MIFVATSWTHDLTHDIRRLKKGEGGLHYYKDNIVAKAKPTTLSTQPHSSIMIAIKTVMQLTSLSMMSILLIPSSPLIQALPNQNDLGRVPPMGWNSWNAYFCTVTEDSMKEATNELIRLGLQEVGYSYVNMDDCWMSHERHNDTKEYQANPKTFPSGIPQLVQYVHDRGFKFGLYTSAGTKTCAGYPGSLYFEELDANTFAKWQVDYLKYDNCYNENIPSIYRYTVMRNALAKTGRPIFYSLCQWGHEHSWQWAPYVGHAWRTTEDIQPTWISIVNNFWQSQQHLEQLLVGKYTRAWADPDLLEIGNGHELTVVEQKTHFALWVMVKAPLMLSTNLTNLSPKLLDIIKNPRLIALHQNANYPPAKCYIGCQPDERKVTPYSILATSNILDESLSIQENGPNVTVAIIVNWSSNVTLKKVTIFSHDFGMVPLPNDIKNNAHDDHQHVVVTDLWTGETVMTMNTHGFVPITIEELKPHDNLMYRFELVKTVNTTNNNDARDSMTTTAAVGATSTTKRHENQPPQEQLSMAKSLRTSSWR
jgi:hypothetical protein